jgi:hypothetical protein
MKKKTAKDAKTRERAPRNEQLAISNGRLWLNAADYGEKAVLHANATSP